MIFIKEEQQKLFTKIKEILTGILFRADSSFFYLLILVTILFFLLLFYYSRHINIFY